MERNNRIFRGVERIENIFGLLLGLCGLQFLRIFF